MTLIRSPEALSARAVSPSATAAPQPSVVVLSNRERSQVELCLTTLLPAATEAGAEVIVVRAGNDAPLLTQAWDGVEFVWCNGGTPVRELAGIGMTRANGHVVLLVEDHWVGREWWAGVLRARVGAGGRGGMRVATFEPVDWAARLRERGVPAPDRSA